jgi:hypothetical protein
MSAPWVKVSEGQEVEIGPESKEETNGTKPCKRFQHVALAVQEKLYIVQGTNGKKFFDDLHIFDPETYRWTNLSPSAECETKEGGRARHTVIAIDKLLYLFGGICKHGFAGNKLYVLDLEKDVKLDSSSVCSGQFTWRKITTKSKSPPSLFDHTAVAYNRTMFVFGGEKQHKKTSNQLFRYSPRNLKWGKELSEVDSFSVQPPPPGKQYKMIASQGSMFVFSSDLSIIYRINVSESDHATSWDKISTRGSIPGNNSKGSADLRQYAICSHRQGNSTNIALFGGLTQNPTCLINNSYLLVIPDREGDKTTTVPEWNEIPKRGRNLPCPRVGQSLTYIRFGGKERIFMFGGYDSLKFLHSFFFLDLQSSLCIKNKKINVVVSKAASGLSLQKISVLHSTTRKMSSPKYFTLTAVPSLIYPHCTQLVAVGGPPNWHVQNSATELEGASKYSLGNRLVSFQSRPFFRIILPNHFFLLPLKGTRFGTH